MWLILALGASVFWGITYSISEQIYHKISPVTSISISSFFVFVISLFLSIRSKRFSSEIGYIITSKKLVFLFLAEILSLILAELLIAYSIKSKNATLSGIIEISYPIFIFAFS